MAHRRNPRSSTAGRRLTPERARLLALGLAGARTLLGVGALAAPALVARPWVGDRPGDPAVSVLGRSLGGRDVALGLGPLLAARRGRPVRGWVEAGVLADLSDVVSTLRQLPSLPRRGRVLVLVASAGAAATGAVAARRI